MNIILRHDQPPGISGSLKWHLSLQASIQWIITVLLWRLSSTASLGHPLPQWLAHLLMLMLAVILTVAALSEWKIVPTIFGNVASIGKHCLQFLPLRIILTLASLIVSVPFFLGSFWWGNILIALQGVLFAVLFWDRSPLLDLHPSRSTLIALAAMLLAVGMIVRGVMALYGPINSDEAVYMEIAKHIAEGRGIWPAFGYLPENTVIRPGLGYALVIYGLWAQLFGSSLISIRLLNMGLGLCVLPFVFSMTRLWYGKRSAVLSISFFALSTVFLFSSTARNNALPMLGLGIALYLHVLAFSRGSWYWHFVAGLSSLLALEAHLLNAFFLISIGGYYLMRYAVRLSREQHIVPGPEMLAFGAGVIVALGVYAYGHLFYQTTPADFMAGMSPWSSRTSLLNNLIIFSDRIRSYWVTAPAESLLIVASIVSAVVRRIPSDRHWLTLMLFAGLGWFVVGGSGSLHYTTFGVPLYLAASGSLFVQGFSAEDYRFRPPLFAAALGTLLVLAAFVVGYTLIMVRIRQREDAELNEVITTVYAEVDHDAGLIAPLRIRPLLMDYEPYIITDSRDLLVAPAMVNQHPDDYWIDVLLDTWPRAYIWIPYPEYDGVTVHAYESYLAARHAEQIAKGVWLIPTQNLTEIDGLSFAQLGLEPVAYIHPIAGVDEVFVETLWVSRRPSDKAFEVELTLVDQSNKAVWQSVKPLISGWGDIPTLAWGAFEFHDVLLEVALPEKAGQYTLIVTLRVDSCDECAFEVPLTIQ